MAADAPRTEEEEGIHALPWTWHRELDQLCTLCKSGCISIAIFCWHHAII